MAKRISSPFTVLRFSWWHFSEAMSGQSSACSGDLSLSPSCTRSRAFKGWDEEFSLTLTGDEADEFANTFLHALLGLFGDLGVLWESILHDTGHWRKVANVSIVEIVFVGLG